MKSVFVGVILGVFICCSTGLSAAAAMREIPVIECMPDVGDYSFMWWANGFNREISTVKTKPIVCFQTGRYGMAIDVENMRIQNLGLIENPEPAEKVVARNNDVVFSLPKAELELFVTIEGKKYVCVGSRPVIETVRGGDHEAQFRIIESGRYVQRADILGLVLEDKEGRRLNAKARLEMTVWSDRIYFLFEVTPQEDLAEVKPEMKIKQAHLKAVAVKTTNPNNILLCLSADKKASAGADSAIVSKAIDLANNTPVKTSFDKPRGRYKIELPEIKLDAETNPRVLDRISVRIENPSSEEKVIPLSFENKIRVMGGLPMIRDSEGNPTGICVQISKNWHMSGQRLLYDGVWHHGLTMLRMPAKSATEFEFNLVRGYWGKLPAVAHSQLCLIGWATNQLWDQVAIGDWGESICYDPDVNLNRSMIDDIRPLMVTASRSTKKGWTQNVGGGDFLVYYNEKNEKQFLTRMRTFYQWYGPNLSKVTYAGVSNDGKIAARITVSSPTGDDLNRALHHFRYDVLEPVSFNRLAFYQLGADRYHAHQFETMARGNSEGLIEEWAVVQKGGLKYHREGIKCDGEAPWFSLHDGIKRSGQGAWANRGLVIRSWKARLNGKTVEASFASVYGTHNFRYPSCNVELSPPQELDQLIPGDFVEAEVELVVMPQKAEDYWGPNENLRKALQKNGNTWKMVHREAIGNNLTVNAVRGELYHRYPIVIQVDDKQTAEVQITGGVGYVPITFIGLERHKDYQLIKIINEQKIKIDQSVYGNDYWQTDYNHTQGKWSITYNISPDSIDDGQTTVTFLFGPKESS